MVIRPILQRTKAGTHEELPLENHPLRPWSIPDRCARCHVYGGQGWWRFVEWLGWRIGWRIGWWLGWRRTSRSPSAAARRTASVHLDHDRVDDRSGRVGAANIQPPRRDHLDDLQGPRRAEEGLRRNRSAQSRLRSNHHRWQPTVGLGQAWRSWLHQQRCSWIRRSSQADLCRHRDQRHPLQEFP